ncbi:hypothetical protein PHYBLDRAFT_71909 [Phycomyces blakesleeanus NRRL 1555(-)]|uniref:Uncharacterized protein n=1 Tax=Phycomyces blakesleeanus (strain ATCC 8743b / DSM 1359 / FGSC 10004 / NBRC 33097 / NRRL 1555) TaxID=763407 RepID=A0A162ZH21_PHYB8|nr:hypothetical protein PHYBLDRAFT_71909 [Phycomyces blakesleeanus NRRL 1555(-)]OAD66661.1 hypothetical protein PHYBLDRAFT_71909 [Phycomyces blakesleeanus NRRL 1555(-)]|eukprot:XP_018284701.1 hypothetical protein PHYBLDRAFT_71909 [Phycomyces blakesleeanus NRRL 1555(-)]
MIGFSILTGGVQRFVAYVKKKVHMYNSVTAATSILFSCPRFEKVINFRRFRQQVPGILFDIYDGAKWNTLKDSNDKQSIAHRRFILLTLNIGWFQPFDKISYSWEAIYLFINNLPREERYKKENIVLFGLIPYAKQAKTSEANHYLCLLVAEPKKVYSGVVISIKKYPSGTLVHAALLPVVCEIPAARKTRGFP